MISDDKHGDIAKSLEPLTILDEGMTTLHELNKTAVRAGFTEQQAIAIVVGMMMGQRQNP